MSFLSRTLWTLVALALAGFFASLGFWQYQRGQEKQRWFDGYAAAMQAAPVSLAERVTSPLEKMPQRIMGQVRFLPQPLLLLDSQQRQGKVGARAYALAEVPPSARVVLVELGWLSIPADRHFPALTAPEGTWSLDGVLLPWPGQGLRPKANPWPTEADMLVLTYLDREEIERKTGISMYDGVLQPSPEWPLGYQRDAGTLPNTLSPRQHQGYAMQWWSLSGAVMVVYGLLVWRRRKK